MSCNILLVEDDDVAVEAITRSIKKASLPFTVTTAEDGQVALDILRGTHKERKIKEPLIVLLDLNMPRMNGFEFLEVIREDQTLKSTVVFILTTSGSEVDRARAYHQNVAGYMIKSMIGPQFSKLFGLMTEYAAIVKLPTLNLPQ